jgi:hypothetical protein
MERPPASNLTHVPLENLSLTPMKPFTDASEKPFAQAEEIEVGAKQKSSGFLDLPLEIRDEIYSLIFVSIVPVCPSKTRAESIAEAINLLRANHQVYAEAVEVLYGRNIFQIRGTPGYKAPELLNLLVFQQREDKPKWPAPQRIPSQTCLARQYLRKISIPSHGISLVRLKQLFSLLKYFPKLEHVQVVYISQDAFRHEQDIFTACRLLRDRLPLIKNFLLYKRINYHEAEDVSWILQERPYRTWFGLSNEPFEKHMWLNDHGVKRKAKIVKAPQNLLE